MSVNISKSPLNCLGTLPGNYVITGGDEMSLVNLTTHHITRLPKPHRSPTKALDISAQTLITSNLNTINYWDLNRGEVVHSIPIPGKENINDLKFVNEHVMVSGGDNCHINLFDLRSFKEVYRLKVSKDNINTIHQENLQIYVSSNDNTLTTVDLRLEQLTSRTFDQVIVNFNLIRSQLLMNLQESGDLEVVNLKANSILNTYKLLPKLLEYQMRFDYDRNRGLIGVGTEQGKVIISNYNPTSHMIIPKSTILLDKGLIVNNVKFFNDDILATTNNGVLHHFDLLDEN